MSTRRSFFSRFAAAVAMIALAPELAFRAKLALPEMVQARMYNRFILGMWSEPYRVEDLLNAKLEYASNQNFYAI